MKKKVHFVTLERVYGETFSLYFRNLLALLTPVIPVFLAFGYGFYRYLIFIIGMDDSGGGNFSAVYWYMGWFGLLTLLFFPLTYGEIKLVSNLYLDIREEASAIIKEAFRRFFPFLGLSILYSLGVMGGMILLIVPAYVIMLGWSVSHVVFVVEKEGGRASLKRSWTLTKGFKGRVFLYFLMALAALYFFLIVLSLIFGTLASGFFGVFSSSMTNASNEGLTLAITFVFMIVYAFLFPLFLVFLTVLYYNLIKEKEGFASAQLADSFLSGDKEEGV